MVTNDIVRIKKIHGNWFLRDKISSHPDEIEGKTNERQ